MAGRPDVVAVFDRVADTYDAVGVPWFTPIAERLVAELAPQPGERAVDVGCGRGAATRALADAVGPSGAVVALDLAPGMVERTAADLRHLGHVEVRLGDARQPDLPAASADVVCASLVLFFLAEPGEVVRRWAALLAPGGRLGISTFAGQDPRFRAVDDLFTPHLPQAVLDARTSGRSGPFATDEGVEALFREAGLEDVRTVRWELQVRFADVEEWRRWSLSHGQRAMWDAVPPAHRADVLRDARELLGDGEIRLGQEVRYTLGRAPAGGAGSPRDVR